MADFAIAYKITMGNEGGYANDPDDSGGETYMGIARNKDSWSGFDIIDSMRHLPTFPKCLDESDELKESAMVFYKKYYWDVNSLDKVNHQEIANELFDTGVNCGVGLAAMILQRALNVSNINQFDYKNIIVDGVIGNKTLDVLNNHKRPKEVLKLLNILQGYRYITICENNERLEKFLNSWLSRVSL